MATPLLAAKASSAVDGIRAAKQEWSARLLGPSTVPQAFAARSLRGVTVAAPDPEQNVVGVGVSEKIAAGVPTGVLCLKFFVRVKFPSSQLSRSEVLPKSVDGIEVDVEEVGTFRALATKTRRKRPRSRRPRPAAPAAAMPNPRTRMRPAQPGCSVGFQMPNPNMTMAGTFGALVRKGTRRYILSNNHVLANEGLLPVASPIFQPGLLDGGRPANDRIAELSDFVPLLAGVHNDVDAAIAEVDQAGAVTREVLHIGAPQGTAAAKMDMIVHKFGRTTSYTVGRVTSLDTDVRVQYDTGTYTFADQIIIQGLDGREFSAGGDSGSLILERGTNVAVGLLFAGGRGFTIANHIGKVLAQFGGISLA